MFIKFSARPLFPSAEMGREKGVIKTRVSAVTFGADDHHRSTSSAFKWTSMKREKAGVASLSVTVDA